MLYTYLVVFICKVFGRYGKSVLDSYNVLVLAKFNFGGSGAAAAGEKENVKMEKREGSRQEFKARSQPTNVYFDHPKYMVH